VSAKLTEDEFEELRANVQVLLDNDHPSEAIRLLEDGVARAEDSFLELWVRHFLATAHFYAGEYTRAASLFDVVGRDYRKASFSERLLRPRLLVSRGSRLR
jgi:hypothetical protein